MDTQIELDSYGGWTGIRSQASGFFRIERIKGRWWFITPDGNVFLSVGVNHADYKEDYSKEFVEFVCSHLQDWGFNTIGWTQESMSPKFDRGQIVHSRGWGQKQYRCVTMPYMHMLRFTDMEWYVNEQFPDVFSNVFAEKCDSVAREFCSQMHDDPKLVGYFYSDTPNWIKWAHITGHDLKRESDQRHFRDIASQYYRVIRNTIRRYDKNHLLLGDRYKGDEVIRVNDNITNGMPDCVLEAMRGLVDVLSIEYYAPFETMREDIHRWYEFLGKPIFLADSAFLAPTDALKIGHGAKVYVPDQAARGRAYQDFARAAFSNPAIVGWHWCAFGRSRGRRSGLLDGDDRPYEECVNLMREFNNNELYSIGAAAGTRNGAKGSR